MRGKHLVCPAVFTATTENTMRFIQTLSRLGLALAACSAGWAFAQDAPVQLVDPFGTPLQNEQLDTFRGGFDMVKNDMQLNGAVTGNSALNVLSGGNAIADGSFANASGLPMVIQNTGSNVSIQNATIVNVQLH